MDNIRHKVTEVAPCLQEEAQQEIRRRYGQKLDQDRSKQEMPSMPKLCSSIKT
jgi:hypothetical protein